MHRRELLATLGALAWARLLHAAPTPHFDAVVGYGSVPDRRAAKYRSIEAAIAAAPADSEQPFRILVSEGAWREKLVVDKPNIHLIGEGRARSTIRFDAAAGQPAPNGEPWGTWGCATLRVCAPGFHARDLTIENGFDYLAHLRRPQLETVGSNGAQAVALMLDRGSDRARIEHCAIIGHQDTLFADAGRSLFRDCRVSGSVDFVFGAGHAVFEQCELISRHRPGKPRQGYIAAPSTPRAQHSGLVFVRCRLHSEPDVPAHSVALGRAWRPTREFPDGRYGDPDALGATAFIECELGAHIAPEGWDAMNYTARDGSRIALQPSEARLAEHANRGPGARMHASRPQLSREQANSLSHSLASLDWAR